MTLLMLGLFILIVFLLVLSMALNYSLFYFENKAIKNLADSIKPAKKDILNQKNRVTSPRLMLPGKKITSQIKSHMLHAEDNEKVAQKLIDKLREFSFDVRQNSYKGIKNTFVYLISLTKPIEELQKEDHEQEIIDQGDKNKDSKNVFTVDQTKPNESKKARITKPVDNTNVEIHTPKLDGVSKINEEKEQTLEEATLNIVSSVDKEKTEDMGLFEKLENRILQKLQSSGMADYDIWLELGDLYVKYNELKKAMEIYALVLKHSKDDRQKEKAMNKLIGL